MNWRSSVSTWPSLGSSIVPVVAAIKTGASSWRWPAREGELPVYVQRMFRVKAFGLLAIQLTVIFVEMLIVETVLDSGRISLSKDNNIIFYVLGTLTLCLIISLHFAKDNFPMNYVLILCTTVLVGMCWGLTRAILQSYLNFQLIGILAVVMMVSTPMAIVLTRESIDSSAAVAFSMFAGWVVASCLDLAITQHFGLSSVTVVAIAIVLTLLLLAMVLVFGAGPLLARCNPDDIVLVIVSMNTALLIMVMPIFVVLCCFLHADSTEPAPETSSGAADLFSDSVVDAAHVVEP